MIRALAAIALSLALAACVPASSLRTAAPNKKLRPRSDAAPGICGDLAYAFYLIADQKQRGRSKREQIEMARESVRSPLVSRPDATLQHLLLAVDLVYLSEDSDPDRIEETVLDHCIENGQGHAVLKRLWPLR